MPREIEPTRSSMWVLAHPIRYRLLELLHDGPSTASRLARRIGESRGSASYHLRVLAGAGAIVEEPDLGTRRERWWRRPEERMLAPSGGDAEMREIGHRMLAVLFARDEDVRRRFATHDTGEAWREGAFVGNWLVALTPAEADELGRRLFVLVDEVRRAPSSDGADQALVSISVLPALGDS